MFEKPQLLKPVSVDDRGSITNIMEGMKITSVLVIVSKKGSVRANHYHKKDSHWVYMVSGRMRYTEMELKKKNPHRKSVILGPGEVVFTKPVVAHSMEFLEDSVFLVLTTNKRDQKSYENDVVRIKVV